LENNKTFIQKQPNQKRRKQKGTEQIMILQTITHHHQSKLIDLDGMFGEVLKGAILNSTEEVNIILKIFAKE
jgi:hypothetical protein